MELPDCAKPNEPGTLDMKKVVGGLLVQELDTKLLGDELKVVTKRAPSEEEMEQLLFAWKVVKQTKSNAIVLAKDSATVGVGPGQTNRVTALDTGDPLCRRQGRGFGHGFGCTSSRSLTVWSWLPSMALLPSFSRAVPSGTRTASRPVMKPVLPWYSPAPVTSSTESGEDQV